MIKVFEDVALAWQWCKVTSGCALIIVDNYNARVALIAHSFDTILQNFTFTNDQLILLDLKRSPHRFMGVDCEICNCEINITKYGESNYSLWVNRNSLINHAVADLRDYVLFNLDIYS